MSDEELSDEERQKTMDHLAELLMQAGMDILIAVDQGGRAIFMVADDVPPAVAIDIMRQLADKIEAGEMTELGRSTVEVEE